VEALEAGAEGNVAIGTLTDLVTPVAGVTATTNAAPLSGGEDVESDESYRARLLLRFTAVDGASTPTDLEQVALSYPGVGFVTVEPNWIGPGFGRIVVMDANNDPVGPTVIDGLQALLDPPSASTTMTGSQVVPVGSFTYTVPSTAGFASSGANMRFYAAGHAFSYTGKTGTTFTGVTVLDPGGWTGTIPAGTKVIQSGQGGTGGEIAMGAEVVVATGALVTANIGGTIVHRAGYSLDGTGGTVATRPAILAALQSYIDRLPPGEDVVLEHVKAAIMSVQPGVYDLSGVTINGSAANLVLTALQVAQLGTVTLT
jgi:uncharacterized phage protein gp47/JayE